ncbi:hypothetical protein JOF41_006350 [Saccharothrix coeruleofusca]|uniref:hypothetical protein n=1 Tax=Saccharothrix coeruleofusca TaxID=33919 RepID=UPI001AEAF69D|nr:hypothetical protein [Saccharothrix coeruleofusca]MBP2340172.1 hypothetical protein [Saccharothrix coeruleofusca]
MSTYGFRVFELFATPLRSFDRVSFTDPEPDGLKPIIHDLAEKRVRSGGEKNEKKAIYSRFDSVRSSGWGVLITASGGYYGESAQVVDVESGEEAHSIATTDAVLRESRVLMLIPPYGETGLLVAETRGRSHLANGVLVQLNNDLKGYGVKLRTVTDLADEHAWNKFLDSEEIGIRSVELVQRTRSIDRTNFTSENVKKSTLIIDLEDDTEVKRRLRGALDELRGTKHRPSLTGMIGLSHYRDEDFDEERIIAVVDGRNRTINITSGWPAFTYTIDTEERPSDLHFVDEACEVARTTFPALNVDLASNWRPRFEG